MPDNRLEIRWLKQALANLDDEAAFIARDHPAGAARVVEGIANKDGNPLNEVRWTA